MGAPPFLLTVNTFGPPVYIDPNLIPRSVVLQVKPIIKLVEDGILLWINIHFTKQLSLFLIGNGEFCYTNSLHLLSVFEYPTGIAPGPVARSRFYGLRLIIYTQGARR